MFKNFINKNISSVNDSNTLIFAQNSNVIYKSKNNNEEIIIEKFDGIWLDVDKIKKVHSLSLPLDSVVLSHWKCCFLNCKYCADDKIDELLNVYHYDIMPFIVQLIDVGLIDKKTKIIFTCGDSTLHPEFDKLLYYFINYGMKDIVLYTSAMRHCYSVAEAMAKEVLKIIIGFDSGCPYIYEKIKGINKFDIAFSNIRKYIDFLGRGSKQIVLSYTLVKGINDNTKEIIDWFMLFKNQGVVEFSFDIDEKWYNELSGSTPAYLVDIFKFVKELSEINNLTIKFSDKIEKLLRK